MTSPPTEWTKKSGRRLGRSRLERHQHTPLHHDGRGGGSAFAVEPPGGLGVLIAQVVRQTGHRRVIEESHDVDDLPQRLLETVDEDRAGDRAAAELEEVLVDADLPLVRQAQHLPELLDQEALQGRRAAPRVRWPVRLRRPPARGAPGGRPCRSRSAAARRGRRRPRGACSRAAARPGRGAGPWRRGPRPST